MISKVIHTEVTVHFLDGKILKGNLSKIYTCEISLKIFDDTVTNTKEKRGWDKRFSANEKTELLFETIQLDFSIVRFLFLFTG